MVKLFDLLQQKIEIFRLEQRYIKRRNRRSTFVSDATYVDGEYVFGSTTTKCSAGGYDDFDVEDSGLASRSNESQETIATKDSKMSRRLSKFGLDKMDWRRGRDADKRMSIVNVREVRSEER